MNATTDTPSPTREQAIAAMARINQAGRCVCEENGRITLEDWEEGSVGHEADLALLQEYYAHDPEGFDTLAQ